MNTDTTKTLDQHSVVPPERWLAERRQLLVREKELMRLQDDIARARRALPWERVEKAYRFDTVHGSRTLAELFDGRSQLLVQHFMLGPGWEQGCPSCSYMADNSDGATIHLAHRDITRIAVSRAPLGEIERFHRRMGWSFEWVSSYGSDFNFDYGVSFRPEDRVDGAVEYNYHRTQVGDEMPGISIFYRDDAGEVFHTYSTFGRGVEVMMGSYFLMDLVPKGRGERDVPHKMEWVRHHDRYGSGPVAHGGHASRE